MAKEQELVPWGWAGKGWMNTIWQTYKLNHEGWRRFYAQQDGKCAGCGKELAHPTERAMGRFGLKPQVDHRHRKDAWGVEQDCREEDVRGLLCAGCNRLLAIVQDNANLLKNLMVYLNQHGDL